MDYTINEVIQDILSTIPGAPFSETVDTVKTGDPAQKVTGIVTTFLANVEVIRKAVGLHANLIITHEPTFYNHLDETAWLKDDPVYAAKRRLAEENGIVIWRFHDHWHAHQPDGILTGAIKSLGWEAYSNPNNKTQFILPSTTLENLALLLKDKLGINTLRFVGDPKMTCHKVAFLVGAWGGQNHIRTLIHEDIDVLIAGEIAEWETSEYVRDAISFGRKVGLIVTGHQPSEESGMAYLAAWLHSRFPGIPVSHVSAESPFIWQ